LRVSQGDTRFRVRAIAGTHVVLMAMDMNADTRKGLRGFAIKRGVSGQPQTFLRGIKFFEELVPHHDPKQDFSSRDQPFQTFLWSNYHASPGTSYDFTIIALYGDIRAFEERHTLAFSIKTEPEFDQGHGVFFNRGTIASHAFETTFNNKPLTDEMTENVSDDGKLLDPETAWLSRGLAEACLKYINDTKQGEGLRVCAYEFTYLPVLRALKRAIDRGVDVQIVYHDTKKEKDPNRAAIAKARLPKSVTHVRTRTQIPHNKFMVKLVGGTPMQVWTGSTNFTDTGFFGQTNVGHQVADAKLAKTYLDYWTELAKDPVHSKALKNAIDLTPNPPNAIAKSSIAAFFSPRKADNMLDWYGQRIDDTASLAMMTIPFNVAMTILAALGQKRDAMRFVILEDIPAPEVNDAEKRNRGKLAFSNGAILGKVVHQVQERGWRRQSRAHSEFGPRPVVCRRGIGAADQQGSRLLRPCQGAADRPVVRRPASLLGLGEFFEELADRQRREHAAHPWQHARRRHLHDRTRSDFPAFSGARHHQCHSRPAQERAAARYDRWLDRAQLQRWYVQEQPPAAVLPADEWQQALECPRCHRRRPFQG
jgi:hypothetical protein